MAGPRKQQQLAAYLANGLFLLLPRLATSTRLLLLHTATSVNGNEREGCRPWVGRGEPALGVEEGHVRRRGPCDTPTPNNNSGHGMAHAGCTQAAGNTSGISVRDMQQIITSS